MKSILIILASLLAFSAVGSADDSATVKVTTFYYTNYNPNNISYPDHTAEICGQIVGKVLATHRIVVTVDPGTNKPAPYTVLPSENGDWCVLVNAYSGKADVKLSGDTHSVSATAIPVTP
ncbi:MAG: hypothetical protein ACXVBW_05310 [Bdellovibrionota bacterium]